MRQYIHDTNELFLQGKIYSDGNENTYTGAMIGQLKTCRYFVNGERLQVLGWFDKVPAFGARALERVQQAVAMQHHLLHQAFRSGIEVHLECFDLHQWDQTGDVNHARLTDHFV